MILTTYYRVDTPNSRNIYLVHVYGDGTTRDEYKGCTFAESDGAAWVRALNAALGRAGTRVDAQSTQDACAGWSAATTTEDEPRWRDGRPATPRAYDRGGYVAGEECA